MWKFNLSAVRGPLSVGKSMIFVDRRHDHFGHRTPDTGHRTPDTGHRTTDNGQKLFAVLLGAAGTIILCFSASPLTFPAFFKNTVPKNSIKPNISLFVTYLRC